MLCLAFHNPANLRQLLDDNSFHVSTIFSEDDIKELNTVSTDKTKVIFCNSINTLKRLSNDSKYKKIINSRKIVCFDIPHNFFVNNFTINDAKNRTDGVWTFQKIDSFNFVPMILKTQKGLKGDNYE